MKINTDNTVKYDSVDSLIAEMDKQTAEENKTLFGWLKNNIYYPIYHKVDRIREFFMWDIKSFIQRGQRGWADRDCWSLDSYLSKVIDETTMHLMSNSHGFPNDLSETEWAAVLIRINETFSIARRISNGDVYLAKTKKDYEKLKPLMSSTLNVLTPEQTKEFWAGFDLFKRHFFSLWD